MQGIQFWNAGIERQEIKKIRRLEVERNSEKKEELKNSRKKAQEIKGKELRE
jgi:hypothetical protein